MLVMPRDYKAKAATKFVMPETTASARSRCASNSAVINKVVNAVIPIFVRIIERGSAIIWVAHGGVREGTGHARPDP